LDAPQFQFVNTIDQASRYRYIRTRVIPAPGSQFPKPEGKISCLSDYIVCHPNSVIESRGFSGWSPGPFVVRVVVYEVAVLASDFWRLEFAFWIGLKFVAVWDSGCWFKFGGYWFGELVFGFRRLAFKCHYDLWLGDR
jgi:hypothetical protein